MRCGIDTNVLVYAHLPGVPEHERVRDWLLAIFSQTDAILVVTPAILHELVHVITDGKRFDPPVPMNEALALAGRYLQASNVECVATDAAATALAFSLLERHRLGRKRLADTLFAATLLSAGVNEMATCNVRDFAVFEGFRLIDPTSDA